MTAPAEPKIGMHGRALVGLSAQPPEGSPPLGEAACGQAPECGSRQVLSSFAEYKLDFMESGGLSREKVHKTAVTVKYSG